MYHKNYSNFVRPASPTERINNTSKFQSNTLSGEEAKKIYLEEVSKVNDGPQTPRNANLKTHPTLKRPAKRKHDEEHISDKDLFFAAQTDDVQTVKDALISCPDKINVMDDYGWSLLMIACQANAIDTVKELLNRGIDTTVRDKAGNSAHSFIIQNKNYILADLLVSHKRRNEEQTKTKILPENRVKLKEFHCCICNQIFPNEQEHLSSTVHNINASKGKKIPTYYAIPQTNRGYQIMLKVGWDRETGLGPQGAGKKYPIKAVQKRDRKGLGQKKEETKEIKDDIVKHRNRKTVAREYESNKKMEINFRREFY